MNFRQRTARDMLLQNGHIRLMSSNSSITIDLESNNKYCVYGDTYGSTTGNTIESAIQQGFNHLGDVTKII